MRPFAVLAGRRRARVACRRVADLMRSSTGGALRGWRSGFVVAAVVAMVSVLSGAAHVGQGLATSELTGLERDQHARDNVTVPDETPTAFGRALRNLDPGRWQEFRQAKQRFVQVWPQRGPWADAAACLDCHYRDGRGPRTGDGHDDRTHLIRLGTPASGDPIYGRQLRREGVGVPAPARFVVEWIESSGRYPSGEPYTLRRPVIGVRALGYGPLGSTTRASLRTPPAVFGLGLLEAVPVEAVLTGADPDDADGDGISGRPQRVSDLVTGHESLGRFGWKAAQPSLLVQSAIALAEDIGVTSPLVPDTPGGHVVGETPGGVSDRAVEVDVADVNKLVRYLRGLAPPRRRQREAVTVQSGERLFSQLGCATCHRPLWDTGVIVGWPELSHQQINPFTDLLLHDMGSDLADEVTEGTALGNEWRTPPLWGLGLLRVVNGDVGLLHDGRARSAEEAVLWHGGEAAQSRRRFVELAAAERRLLLGFLDSL